MRRSIATLTATALIATTIALAPTPAQAATPADFAAVRAVYAASYTGGDGYSVTDPLLVDRLASLSAEADAAWGSLDVSPTRTFLWSDIPKSTTQSEYIQLNYQRLSTLALAYSTRGTDQEGDAALLADLVSALDWINTHWYSATTTKYGNWYPWEIGGPLSLNTITVLLYDELTVAQRTAYMSAVAHFAPINRWDEGANRAWAAQITMTRGLIMDDEATLLAGRNAIPSLLNYRACAPVGGVLTCESDGFYADGSSISHRYFSYSTGYGLAYLRVVTNLVYWLAGSPWAITGTSLGNLVAWAIDGYLPIVARGVALPGTAGRDISRLTVDPQSLGARVTAMVLKVASLASGAEATLLKSSVKTWILSTVPAGDFFLRASIPEIVAAQALLDDPSISGTLDTSIFRHYAVMDRVVQQRPGYLFSVNLYSNRTKTFETINGENTRGWHTGDGMTTLFVGDDLDQYSGNYWPTVDPYRLPGTTVLATTQKGSTLNSSTFAGGVELQGLYGSSAMIMGSSGASPSARKSWFMFDDEIVALGTNIASTSSSSVETIVDNRRLSGAGTDALLVNGTAMPTGSFSSTVPGVTWAHLAGQSANSGIGYYFPAAITVTAKRETRTGSWSAINSLAPYNDPTVQTNTFASLGIAHGVAPTSAGYRYVLLPGATSSQTSAYAANPDIQILARDSEVHAVKDNTLNMIGAQFFIDGAHAVSVGSNYPDYLASDRKASVMTWQQPGKLTIAVADPTFAATGVITVEVKTSTVGVLSASPGVTVIQHAPTTIIQVDVTGSRGATREIVLNR